VIRKEVVNDLLESLNKADSNLNATFDEAAGEIIVDVPGTDYCVSWGYGKPDHVIWQGVLGRKNTDEMYCLLNSPLVFEDDIASASRFILSAAYGFQKILSVGLGFD
jgi:hypothetical protein